MIKLSASLGKKLPIPGRSFSSRQCGAAMEIEVSDTAGPREVGEKLRRLYETLERSIDAQFGDAASEPVEARPPAAANRSNGKCVRRSHRASDAQVQALLAIGEDRAVGQDELAQILRGEFGVDRPDELDTRQASELIGMLQGMARTER